MPGLLPTHTAADTSSLPVDSELTLGPGDSVIPLSLSDSLSFSPESRGDFDIIVSTPRSGFELDCNYTSKRAVFN